MKISPDMKAVYVKAGKTFVQATLPAAAALYSHLVVTHTAVPTATLESAGLGSAAAALSVVWNGALTYNQRAKAAKAAKDTEDLLKLGDAIDQAVKHALATQTPTPAAPAA